ncbi:MAG: AEC family transporter [Candidatus Hydrogenedentota bacterium]
MSGVLWARLATLAGMILLGFLARRRYQVGAASLSALSMDLLLPPFVFLSLLDVHLDPSELLHPAFSCVVVILATIGFLLLLGRFLGRSLTLFIVPIAFMNSGFLAIPVADALGGAVWVSRAVVYDQAMNVVLFTVGLMILGARVSAGHRIRLLVLNPVLISLVLGIAWKMLDLPLPIPLRTILQMPAQAAVPVALIAMGAAVADLRLDRLHGVGWAVAGRFLLGGFFAYLYCALAAPGAAVAKLIFIQSAMPSAVFSFILAEKYDVEPDFAAGTVVVSTAIYPLVLPLLLAVAEILF